VSAEETMHRWWHEVWEDGRDELVPELVTDPYVRHSASGVVRRDHAELRKDLRQFQRVMHHPTVTVDDVAYVDDKVWTRLTMEGANFETGEVRVVVWLQLHRLEGDKIAETWMLYANGIDWR
jgi:hypothetical protein